MNESENITKLGEACINNSQAIIATNARITMLEEAIYSKRQVVNKPTGFLARLFRNPPKKEQQDD